MRKFILIWFGQLVSTIGSYMSEFALTLWAWELTGSATALALVGFFSLLPRIFISFDTFVSPTPFSVVMGCCSNLFLDKINSCNDRFSEFYF